MSIETPNVFRRAAQDTIKFFGWNLRILTLPFFFALGTGIHFWRFGWDAAMDEIEVLISYGLAPAGGFAAILFLWNLFLTPTRLLAEEIQSLRSGVAIAGVKAKSELRIFDFEPPDYTPWRGLETAKIIEIARLCAGEEPYSTPLSGREKSFERLIYEGVENRIIARADKAKRQTRAASDDQEAEHEEYYPKLTSASVVYVQDVGDYFDEIGIDTDFFADDAR